MELMLLRHFCFFLILAILPFPSGCHSPEFDPYEALGVRRHSSADEIRKTYKKLAREWHPDKNKAPEANERFTNINKAYEILGDEKKKDQYDRFGQLGDSPAQSRGHHGAQFFRTPFGDFQFFNEGFGGANSNVNRITARFLQNRIIPESHEKPYFFFATTDFCFSCVRVQPIWNQFTKDLEVLDLGFGVVDVDYEGQVVKRLKIPRIPCIGAVVNGRSIIFDTEEHSVKNLRIFTRKLLPDNLITTVTEDSLDEFLSGWKDNKVRVLFFGTQGLPTMRLLFALYQIQRHVHCAYLDISADGSNAIVDRFDVETNLETLLIFNEDSNGPVYTESSKEFKPSKLLSAIRSNKYLKLPRISSPLIFDELCPTNPNRGSTKYCVILTFDSSRFHEKEVLLLREMMSAVSIPSNTRFMYAFTDVQKSMMNTLKRPTGNFQIVFFHRKHGTEVEFSWMEWCTDTCRKPLEGILSRLAVGQYKFSGRNFDRYDIMDELQARLFYRILKRLRDWWDHFTYTYFDGDHTMTLVTILSTTICIGIISLLVSMLNSQSKSTTPKSSNRDSNSPNTRLPSRDDRKFVIYDLRNHNYDKLIKESPAGYRLLLLFIDAESKQRYIRRFADLMMPFKSTPYFVFGFIYVDKYLNWYQRLLAQTVGHRDQLKNICPELCVGTVLAINGCRKYYHIYHPKTLNITNKSSGDDDGAFIGLDDSSDDSDTEAINRHGMNGHSNEIDGDELLAQDRILDGLGHWVDRLFDGSLVKCRVDHWPLFPVDEKPDTKKKED